MHPKPKHDEASRKAIALRPVSTRSRAWLAALAALLPIVIIAIAGGIALTQSAPEQLTIVPTLILLASVLLVAVVSFGLDRLMRRHSLTLDAETLEITTTFYRRRLSIGQLDLEKARVIDLAEHTAYKPILKTNGMNVPGFNSGWFRMRNLERAFVATSDGPRVLLIPTHEKFNLLLQPMQPQMLLDLLRELAGKRAAR